MKKYSIYSLLIVLLATCNVKKRDFFQNFKPNSIVLDTFSLSNLKGFGLAQSSEVKFGKKYYSFNAVKNDIYCNGLFRHSSDKIYFLPEGCETEFLFLDLSWKKSSSIKSRSQITKNQSIYSVEWLGQNYNPSLRDSVFNIKIRSSSIFNRSEDLIFEITKDLKIISIEQINCKNDTLRISLSPNERVYFKHFNSATVCL
jgi:hypothetical protein